MVAEIRACSQAVGFYTTFRDARRGGKYYTPAPLGFDIGGRALLDRNQGVL